jgi:hypothetical protein
MSSQTLNSRKFALSFLPSTMPDNSNSYIGSTF